MGHHLVDWLAGFRVPHARRLISATGQYAFPIRAVTDRGNAIIMLEQFLKQLPRGHAPEPAGAVGAAGCQRPAIGTERQDADTTGVHQRLTNREAGVCVPQPSRRVAASRREQLAIRAEGKAFDRLLMLHRFAYRLPRGRIPEPDCAVREAGQEQCAVWAKTHLPCQVRAAEQVPLNAQLAAPAAQIDANYTAKL